MKLSRRILLRGAAGSALSLPLLESLGCTESRSLGYRTVTLDYTTPGKN